MQFVFAYLCITGNPREMVKVFPSRVHMDGTQATARKANWRFDGDGVEGRCVSRNRIALMYALIYEYYINII